MRPWLRWSLAALLGTAACYDFQKDLSTCRGPGGACTDGGSVVSPDASIDAGPVDGGGTDAGGTDGGATDAGVADGGLDGGFIGVTGVEFITFVSDGDAGQVTTAIPINFPSLSYSPSAWVYDGGSWMEYRGTGTVNGTFSIPNIFPGTSYYLLFYPSSLAKTYVVTSARTLDLGEHHLGRSDVQGPAANSTLRVILGGIDPWMDGDEVFLASGGANTTLQIVTPEMQTPDSGVFDGSFPYPSYANRIEASKGDKSVVFQRRPVLADSDAGEYAHASGPGAIFTGFNMTASPTITLAGTLGLPSGDGGIQRVKSSLLRTQFSPLLSNAATGGVANLGLFAFVETAPLVANGGLYGYFPQLVSLITLRTDYDVGLNIPFTQPFPSGWDLVGGWTLGYQYTSSCGLADGGMGTATVTESSGAADFLAKINAIAPIGNLPSNVSVGQGTNFCAGAPGVGLTPAISWTAVTGANFYRVTVYQTGPNGGAAWPVASIYTTAPSITLPPAVLLSGNWYALGVSAVLENSADIQRAPARSKLLPYEYETAVTCFFTP